MFNKKMVVIGMLLLCTINCMLIAERTFLFDWQIRDSIVPELEGITPVPHPWHHKKADDLEYIKLYDKLYKANKPLGVMIQYDTNPLDGSKDKHALSTIMGYVKRLDFVGADFEDPNRDAKTLEMVRQVRSFRNLDVNSAYIANYDDFPGAIDISERWPSMSNRTARDAFYRNSGLNIANPSCYPYEYYSIHTWPSQWGTNICPNKRSALFWAPLEKFSVAKRNLPAGHLLIPWVGRFVEIEGEQYHAPVPTREDVRALIQHMRLRGADGYYREAGILSLKVSVDVNENNENMRDSLAAWQSLDKIFEASGTVTILNLDTNKTGGIEWSGVQKGSKIAILVSNLGNSSQRVALTSRPGLPDYSDYVAPGKHILKVYDISKEIVVEKK